MIRCSAPTGTTKNVAIRVNPRFMFVMWSLFSQAHIIAQNDIEDGRLFSAIKIYLKYQNRYI